MAMLMRIALLLILSWIVGMSQPLVTLFNTNLSGRDVILISGGLFLIWKSTKEVHQLLEGEEGEASAHVPASFGGVVLQIILIDLVFSIDSIVTAIGMVDHVSVMIAAVVVSVGLMMLFAKPIGDFVSAHPTVKMLALSFLFVIGIVLIADGFDHHVPKGYVYFAMAFSVIVEMLNLRTRKRAGKAVEPVHLHERYTKE